MRATPRRGATTLADRRTAFPLPARRARATTSRDRHGLAGVEYRPLVEPAFIWLADWAYVHGEHDVVEELRLAAAELERRADLVERLRADGWEVELERDDPRTGRRTYAAMRSFASEAEAKAARDRVGAADFPFRFGMPEA